MLPSSQPMTDNEQVTNTEVTSVEMPSAELACEQTLDASAVFIGLVNPKTPVNVGGIMRASGCYGVNGVFYTGRRYELAARSGLCNTMSILKMLASAFRSRASLHC
ncbi:RNA methyltransferase [Shewanella putrefaciens]|nr:RNA methyltransferase [Shewanella putrefaciens]